MRDRATPPITRNRATPDSQILKPWPGSSSHAEPGNTRISDSQTLARLHQSHGTGQHQIIRFADPGPIPPVTRNRATPDSQILGISDSQKILRIWEPSESENLRNLRISNSGPVGPVTRNWATPDSQILWFSERLKNLGSQALARCHQPGTTRFSSFLIFQIYQILRFFRFSFFVWESENLRISENLRN